MYARTEDRDTATTWATREEQYDAVCTWGIPDHAKLQRPSCLEMPVFVANGDSDPMILPRYSYSEPGSTSARSQMPGSIVSRDAAWLPNCHRDRAAPPTCMPVMSDWRCPMTDDLPRHQRPDQG